MFSKLLKLFKRTFYEKLQYKQGQSVAPETIQKEKWGSRWEFLLSCIGYAVGAGNIWRFPYLTFKNGGGVFLIPYFIMLFICGIPLFCAELALGQYSGKGTLAVWKSVPGFKGIGMGMIVVSSLAMVYYNFVIAYSLFYMGSSFQNPVPWTSCDQWWNRLDTRALCEIVRDLNETQKSCSTNETLGVYFKDDSELQEYWTDQFSNNANYSEFKPVNISALFDREAETRINPSEEFWTRRVLQRESNHTDYFPEDKYTLDNIGGCIWELITCNTCAWIIIFLCLMKGIKSSGKVVYVTATFPYLVILILVIFGATLDGAAYGIEFYLKPDWSKLSDGNIWSDAAAQIFFSLSVSFGGLITMASYNEYDASVVRDTFIICLTNCFTSIFAGFGVFSFIGYLAKKNCATIAQVVAGGPGLAFIAYPEAIGLFPYPAAQIFGVLFFLMMITLGMDSQFVFVDVGVTSLVDEYPVFFRQRWRKMLLTATWCIVGWLVGIPLTYNAGFYVFTIFDSYCAYYGLLLLSLSFVIAVAYCYNLLTTKFRLIENIKDMTGNVNVVSQWYFKFMWFIGSPGLLIFILAYAFKDYDTIGNNFGDTDIFPEWSNTVAMIMTFTPFAPIPIYLIYSVITRGKGAFYPTDDWGPQYVAPAVGNGHNPAYKPEENEL